MSFSARLRSCPPFGEELCKAVAVTIAYLRVCAFHFIENRPVLFRHHLHPAQFPLGLDGARVLAAGDTLNDLSMLISGLPAVAVGGAEAAAGGEEGLRA